MNTRLFFPIYAIILVIILLNGTVSAAKVTLGDVKVNGPGEQATLRLVLDEAPDGLAGYNVNITFNLDIVKIKKVDFPAWAKLKEVNGLGEGNEVQLMAVDLGYNVQSGAKNVELATITIEGLKEGSTYLHLHRDRFDDHKENSIERALIDGSFTVGNAPVATYKPTVAPASQIQGISTSGPAPVVPTAAAYATPKVLYSPIGPIIPIIGLILCILICAGGYLRRR